MPDISRIKDYEKKIDKQEKEILKLEKEIEAREDKILKNEKKIFNFMGGFKYLIGGVTKVEAQFIREGFARRFNKHKIIYTITIITSVVLVWRGIWHLADATPGISNPVISILLGFFILWFIDRVNQL